MMWWVRVSFANNAEGRQFHRTVFFTAAVTVIFILERRRKELFVHFHIFQGIHSGQGQISRILGWLGVG